MPLNFFDYLLNPFRVMATAITAAIASGLGVAVKSLGSLLVESETRAWTIDLADSTSGIFALLALTLWSLVLADILYKKKAGRMFFLIAATPVLFFLATILRGITLCMIAQGLSAQTATSLNKQYPAIVMIAFFLLLQFAWIRILALNPRSVRERLQAMTKPQSPPPPSATPPSRDGFL